MGRRYRKRKIDTDDSTQSETDSSVDRRRRRSKRKKERRHKSQNHDDDSYTTRTSQPRYRGTGEDDLPSESQVPELIQGTDQYDEPIIPTASVSATVTQPSIDLDSNIFLTAFKQLVQDMKTVDRGSERFPSLNVLPEFDPAKRDQTIDMWISKVNECTQMYKWTERQTIHYALPKLMGLAQRWYQGLPSLLFSWAEWQDKLILAFPSAENYGQLLTDMLACKAKYGESLEEYYYQKMVLLNRCNIFGKNAIDCILFGIEATSVRTSAEAVQFTEADKLLVFLRNVRINKKQDSSNSAMQPGNPENKQSRNYNKANYNETDTGSSKGRASTPKCYNCGEIGHTYFKCTQRIKRCDKCQKIGHESSNCPEKKDKSDLSKTTMNN